MSLSICMIAKDEEHNIGRALASVREVADDIVVVDTGSKDGTIEVAQKYKARVFYRPWGDDFADMRNYSLAKADRTTWQAWMDADDELTPEGARRLAEIKNDPADCIIGWMLENVGVLPEAEKDVGVIRAFQQRMLPRGVTFTGAIHETVTESAKQKWLVTYNFGSIVVKHHGYAGKDISDKLFRNSRILVVSEGFPSDCKGFVLPDGYFGFYSRPSLVVVKDMQIIGVRVLPEGMRDETNAAAAAAVLACQKEHGCFQELSLVEELERAMKVMEEESARFLEGVSI